MLVAAGSGHFMPPNTQPGNGHLPIFSPASTISADIGGVEYARAMVQENPEALINDRAIPYQPDPDIDALTGKKQKSWYAFWK